MRTGRGRPLRKRLQAAYGLHHAGGSERQRALESLGSTHSVPFRKAGVARVQCGLVGREVSASQSLELMR
jgi:hypothetical protein